MNKIRINSSEFTTLVQKHIKRSKIWEKGSYSRLYISDCDFTAIYNTKKCKQNVYINLHTFEVVCTTDCPSQSNAWEQNENTRVIESLAPFARLLRILCKDTIELSSKSAEVIMQEAILEQQPVIGYYTEWRNVRIQINRFGKLANRNREFYVAFSGNKSNAPFSFVYNSVDELTILSNHRYASNGIALVRDVFIIQSYLGLRIRDFKTLMKNLKLHIRRVGRSMYFEIKTSKTGEVVTIPVNKIIRKILKTRGLEFAIKFSYQYYNKTIKLLARRAGLVQKIVVSKTIGGRRVDIIKFKYELMSSHTARRNFATNAYLAGVPVLAIMKITGHKTINSFLRYIRCASLESAINIAKHPFFK